jgi:hypothetical protein
MYNENFPCSGVAWLSTSTLTRRSKGTLNISLGERGGGSAKNAIGFSLRARYYLWRGGGIIDACHCVTDGGKDEH